MQAALGVGGIALGAGTASTTAAAASKVAPLLMSIGVAKWVGVVAIGTGAALGAAVVHHDARSRKVSAAAASPAATLVARVAWTADVPRVDVPVPGPLPPATLAPAPARASVSPGAAPQAVRAPAGTASGTRADLVSELALLDRAHKALDAGDTELALATLDRRDLEFTPGDLAPESLALRIEAYAQRRDVVKVRELGRLFLSRYTGHPQAARIRSLMDDGTRR